MTTKLRLYDGQANNPMTVRLFALERKNLTFNVTKIDIMNLENRRLPYRTKINPRGELPALVINENTPDQTIITEITAICEYLDEIATSGPSLFGNTPIERATTRMWLRRIDLEIAQPIIQYYRNDPDTIDFYQGNRIPTPDPTTRTIQKVQIHQALNRLEDDLEGKTWLCGERFSAADVHFYGLCKFMVGKGGPCEWVLVPGRKNVWGYFERFDAREAAKGSLSGFEDGVVVEL